LQCVFESLDAECSCWMMSGPESRGIGQAKQNVSDTYRSRAYEPDRSVIPRYSWRYRYTRDTQRASDRIRSHTVGNDRCKSVVDSFNIERSQLHEPVKCVVRGGRNVDAIGHKAIYLDLWPHDINGFSIESVLSAWVRGRNGGLGSL
jgi:hypothetical protein